MSQDQNSLYHLQYWQQPMGINDTHNEPISDIEAAEMRQAVTQKLSNLPALLHHLAVGSTWERSAEQSMTEYQLLDSAAQYIDILKAMNIRDREQLQEEAERKKKEKAPGVLKAMKYRVCPKEMQKTRNEMRELRERGCPIRCVEDCMPEITAGIQGMDKWYLYTTPNFVYVLENMERVMGRVRATAIKLQTDNPDGHWAIELLNFYSDGWFVYLDDLNSTVIDYWFDDAFDSRMEAAKQRAKVAEEIIEEVEKESRKNAYGYW